MMFVVYWNGDYVFVFFSVVVVVVCVVVVLVGFGYEKCNVEFGGFVFKFL